MNRALIFAGLCVLYAASASAQEPRLLARLDPVTARAVQTEVDSARAARLPVEPLIQKALEGKSKGAAGDRILAAVRAFRLALGRSRDALDASASDAELIAGANALRAGVEPGFLATLRQTREGPIAVPLDVLTDLIARGVKPPAAASAVERLLRQGRNDRDLLRLRDQVDRDIRAGFAAPAALERQLTGIPAGGPPRTP